MPSGFGAMAAVMEALAGKDKKEDKKSEGKAKKTKSTRPRLPSGIGSLRYSQPVAKEPLSDDLYSMLLGRDTLGLREQRQGYRRIYDELADLRDKAEAAPEKTDLTNLLLASDIWNKTNIASRYKAPKSKQERLDEITGMEANLNKLASKLSDNELATLAAQFQPYASASSFSLGRPGGGSGGRSGKRGKMLTGSEARQIADLKTQMGTVDRLLADWRRGTKPSENIGDYFWEKIKASLNPLGTEAEYKDTLKQKAQLIGRALEGGKLSDVDYTKYIKFLPQPGDTEERALNRINALKLELGKTYEQRVRTFGEVGFDISGIAGSGYSPALGRGATSTPAAKKETRSDGVKIRKKAAAPKSQRKRKTMTKEEFYKSKGWD